MKKRLNPLLLAFSVCVLLFAGCQSSELKSYSDEAAKTAANGTRTAVTDYSPVYESYDPDTVMLTVNGYNVTWAELFYWYYSDVSFVEQNMGRINWDEIYGDTGMTYREIITNNALDSTKFYRMIESKASDLNITLSEEDKAAIDERWQANVESSSKDEEAYIQDIKDSYASKELYYYFNETMSLAYAIQEELYGESGEKLDEADVLQDDAVNGYVRAKHILIMTTAADDTGASVPLSEEEIAGKKQTMENLAAELSQISDPEALAARFDEMIGEYSEDPGHSVYPDGYTFIPGAGSYAESFENAAAGIEEYQISDIVETDYGYHLLLRLPLSATATVQYDNYGAQYSLTYIVARERFSKSLDTWLEECEVVFSKEYEEMDIVALFDKAIYPPEDSAEPVASADPAG